MTPRLLALDYDGVVLDSLKEKLMVGFNGYLAAGGETGLLGGVPLSFEDVDERLGAEPELCAAFRRMVPFIGDIGENALAIGLLSAGREPESRAAFQGLVSQTDASLVARYHEYTLDLRRTWGTDRPGDYGRLAPVFDHMLPLLRSGALPMRTVVCTAKPVENVRLCNRLFGLQDALGEIHKCDAQRSKADLLVDLADRHGFETTAVVFIDDFARHLLPAQEVGISCYLATWGFGGSHALDRAREAGIPTLDPGGLTALAKTWATP